MAKRKQSRRRTGHGTDYDGPWKEAIDRFFEACLAFFFPQAHADIDWTRPYEALESELQRIVRKSKHGRRRVDKLVKVWLKTGEERWLLIHVEVQARKQGEFPKRMYVYNYRIFDRFDREVISMAVLADDDPGWRPSHYGYGRWGFQTSVDFPVVKLLDYAPNCEALEANPNPFATVVLAHLKTMETRKAPADRRAWKVRLVKGLYERGLRAEDVRQLFRFIDWLMDLPDPLEAQFWQEITQYQEGKRMPFIDIAERTGMEKGLVEGIEVGLKLKFGEAGLELMSEIREIRDHEILSAVLQAIVSASSADELRRVWARGRRPKKTQKE
ncbi:MAG TPA: hypothetical protein VMV69_13045 [Pirellulales bacterium]|nr:hypothetical protein [Pirellulales bacterium]